MSQNAFGPNLRRLRLQRGISLEQIAEATKISGDLWAGLERNDFSRWPTGLYARAFVRQYACAIGVDADATVDEFCRWYPKGDRRAERLVRVHAEIVGHTIDWQEDVPDALRSDRRGQPPPPAAAGRQSQSPLAALFMRLRRALGKA